MAAVKRKKSEPDLEIQLEKFQSIFSKLHEAQNNHSLQISTSDIFA